MVPEAISFPVYVLYGSNPFSPIPDNMIFVMYKDT